MKFICRCAEEFADLIGLLAHYEVHGGVPKARVRDMKELCSCVGTSTDSCDTGAVRNIVPVELIAAMPYLSKSPSSSSVCDVPDSTSRHDWRAF